MNRRPDKPASDVAQAVFPVAQETAEAAGRILMRHLGGLTSETIEQKERADYVTAADRESERFILDRLRGTFPEVGALAEESGDTTPTPGEGPRWIIDPLDGTTNFIHGFPVFSVSIALEAGRQIVFGIVHDPLRKETFHAIRDQGAFFNGQTLHVVNRQPLEESLVGTGFPFKRRQLLDAYLDSFRRVFALVSDIRRAGSAALDLAWLAAGRLDGFWECGLLPWDVAAGSLLIEEAGGIVTDFSGAGEAVWTGNVVAGNTALHGELLSRVKESFRDRVRELEGE